MAEATMIRFPRASAARISADIYRKIIDRVFRPMTLGRLVMDLPDGRQMVYGRGEGGVEARIRIHRDAFFRKCVFYGDVGFGESYVEGDWDTPDITRVIAWMILNVEHHPTLMSDRKKRVPVNLLKICNNLLVPLRRNSVRGSRRNIQAHYDLSNDLYRLFLDPSMTYSAAYFKDQGDSLEKAQYQKFEALCQKIRLKAGDHVLEIGSGWGGFAVYAAKNFGCRVTTVTVSQQQFDYALARVREEGLEGRVDVQLKDYRLLDGRYDKIVSIEMLEAVGHEYYETYFRQCHRLLKNDGLLALQVIMSPDHRYESFRKNIDWIQKHIFPGSLLPSMAVIQQAVRATGDLCLHDFEDMTMHYVRTLRQWHQNFNRAAEAVKALGFDEAFIRKWNYYLCYCEAAFHQRNISVAQIVFSRPNNLGLNTV